MEAAGCGRAPAAGPAPSEWAWCAAQDVLRDLFQAPALPAAFSAGFPAAAGRAGARRAGPRPPLVLTPPSGGRARSAAPAQAAAPLARPGAALGARVLAAVLASRATGCRQTQ